VVALTRAIFHCRFAVGLIVLGLILGVSGNGRLGYGQEAAPTGKPVPPYTADGLRIRQVPAVLPPSPFPLDGKSRKLQSLEFRTPEQMTAVDARQAINAQVAIAERAVHQGFRVDLNAVDGAGGENEHAWKYEQAVCPVFPDHLILEYSLDRGHGDVSLFSAIVPRGNEGHVRVIPVRRRNYSLWTPTPTNELTLNDFNHMVKESSDGLDPDWATVGLCYAALAGGHVKLAEQATDTRLETFPLYSPAMLKVGSNGAEVRFADVASYRESSPRVMEWVLVFSKTGRLIKVRHASARGVTARVVPATPEPQGRPVRSAVDLTTRPVPANPTN
jgi:hypothetical protein